VKKVFSKFDGFGRQIGHNPNPYSYLCVHSVRPDKHRTCTGQRADKRTERGRPQRTRSVRNRISPYGLNADEGVRTPYVL